MERWKWEGINTNRMLWGLTLVAFVLADYAGIVRGLTNPNDVQAIESLYASLGSPLLPAWVGSGGDPCAQQWQGVTCNADSEIASIVLNGANLGGQLGDSLGSFSSISNIDFSNNHIGGSIPSTLPISLQNLFLADNNFIGSIPNSISSLTSLSAMSLNNNHLSGDIPDAFQSMTQLVNLDLSNNELNGQLPPSFASLNKLSSLHLQSNQLSGTLDVLQDLNLMDLNVEGNEFTGPIPDSLLRIRNFRYDKNMGDSAASPAWPPSAADSASDESPPSSPAPLPFGLSPSPPKEKSPANNKAPESPAADGPSPAKKVSPGSVRKSHKSKVVIWVVIASVMALVILALCCLLLLPICRRRRNDETETMSKRRQVGAYKNNRGDVSSPPPPPPQPPTQTLQDIRKVPKEAKRDDDIAPPKPIQLDAQWANRGNCRALHEIDMSDVDDDDMSSSSPAPPRPLSPPSPPPPPPPRPLSPPLQKLIVAPILPPLAQYKGRALTSAKSFTIASLGDYTNTFSQDNRIGSGMLGNVYKALLPDGSLLAVKKLDKRSAAHLKDDDFMDLVKSIDRIRHPNVVELVGYCTEQGERMLIYEFCRNGTLLEALHSEKKKLAWNSRIKIALGAGRALEYLHEVCQPPVVHRNFKSGNIILDEDLNGHVADCGLGPLITSGSVSQLSEQLLTTYGYGAPESESGVQSDVYSFGVVMLELLTGRQSYDKTRVHGEQFLARWAIPQLHDIDTLSKMVDPSLQGEYTAKSLSHFADIISRCLQSQPEFRPQMSEVVQDLTNVIRREWSSNESLED